MPSFRLSITPSKRAAARFISKVRRELQKALAEERVRRGITQSDIAREIGVHRSVIHRQLLGAEDITLGRVGELAQALGYEADFQLRKPQSVPGANHSSSIAPIATTDSPPLRVLPALRAKQTA